MAKVRITTEAYADLCRVPLLIRHRFDAILTRLADWPKVSGAKPLRGRLKGHYRMRTGDWRIIFRPHGDEVWIVRVDNRRDVYGD